MERKIIHIDMDAFYASVEMRDNPKLKGKPLIIGAMPGTRGVVSTCSYEARKFGVRSAMSITEAYSLCPDGIYMHPDIGKYARESEKIHKIMESYTDMIEYVSLDEGYMDVTASLKIFGSAENIALDLKRRVLEETGLTCSVGVGYSMLAAKTASEEKKPDGFFVIPTRESFINLIKDRDVGTLFGVGVKTAQRLKEKGFCKISDLQCAGDNDVKFLGNTGVELLKHANGYDLREVKPNEEQKSVGREYTFQTDLTKRTEIEELIHFISRQVSNQLKYKELIGKTVTLKVKYSDMKLVTRSKTVGYTNSAKEICRVATELLSQLELKKSVRLVGISVSNMEDDEDCGQMSFEDILEMDESKNEKIDDMIFSINKNMGKSTLKTGKELLAERNFRNY